MLRLMHLKRYRKHIGWTAVAITAVVNPYVVAAILGRDDISASLLLIVGVPGLALLSIGLTLLLPAPRPRVARGARIIGFFGYTLSLALLPAAAFEVYVYLYGNPLSVVDFSPFPDHERWPPELTGNRKYATNPAGLTAYRPFDSDIVTINTLGYRTPAPAPARWDEFRIALTGGSETFGWRVADTDTLARQLERALAAAGATNVRVFNLGIEGIRLGAELRHLSYAHRHYGFDAAIFFSGGNDAIELAHQGCSLQPPLSARVSSSVGNFAVVHLAAAAAIDNWLAPPLDWQASADRLFNANLRKDLEAAATTCGERQLPCVFVIQPSLIDKQPPAPTEK